ncbi:MAG: two-component system, OmpR family, copper resistance phosphate regulon response regulator CusR [Patescibacteria group bacterium]|jgi:two-component system response regulator MprA|nr:two-component system, OmpR family, copper resistance phosphate regulon response regulator CusR [Patescibacteria group bacterium]
MVHSILIIEDDKELQRYYKNLLLANDYITTITENKIQTLEFLKKTLPDLIIFDVETLHENDEILYTQLHNNYPELPILIITTEKNMDLIKHFEINDQYYLLKPFDTENFITRINAILEKNGTHKETFLQIADLTLDTKTLEVHRGGEEIRLTPLEFKLLQYLMSNQGRILTRQMILSRIWLYSSDIETRVVDVYVGYLRKKLDTGHTQKLVHSIRGFGYVIKE